jgi:hypothetical protein
MSRRLLVALAVAGLTFAAAGNGVHAASKLPETWDGLVNVKAKMGAVYLAPGADFRAYAKVMLDPTEAAFHKDFKRDTNSKTRGASGRISDSDIEAMAAQARAAAGDIFTKELTAGGYTVVAAPGPDVLRLRTALINISVDAPEAAQSIGRSRIYTQKAGEATLVVEARDSVTGALLGRAVDRRFAGDNSEGMPRNRATNTADFSRLIRAWAKATVKGLNELKALSPVGGGA